MTEHDGRPPEEATEAVDRAADVFRELGDPTRVGIIAELVSAQRAGQAPLSFGEIRRRVGVSDSGRFNYHLNQLQPRFVQSVDGGYEPRYAAILAERLVAAPAVSTETVSLEGPVDRPCVLCGDQPHARFTSDRLTVTCATYDEQLLGIPVPPAVAADRSLSGLVDFAEAYGWNQFSMAVEDLCPHCWGPIETAFSPGEPDVDIPSEAVSSVQVDFECRRCGHHFTMPLRLVVRDHPAVAGFHYDHGIDLSEHGLLACYEAMAVSSAETDGDHATLAFERDGDSLEVEANDDLEITAVSRHP